MKRLYILLTCLLMAISLFACNSNSKNSASTEAALDTYTSDSFLTVESTSDLNTNINENSKIIYTADIDYETKDFDEAVNILNEKIDKYKGYIVTRNEYKYGEDSQYINGYYTIRIPINNYSEFLNEGEDIGNITSISENANDVTDEYIDTTARLENLKLQEESLQNLLSKANDIKDIIEIQNSLSDVRGDIESYESRIKYYDTLTEYASININISQVSVYTSNKTTLEKFNDMLKDSIDSFKEVLGSLVRMIIYALPYLIVLGILVLIIIKFKKHKKDKESER